MIDSYDSIFEIECDAICVPTHGYIASNTEEYVMTRGLTKNMSNGFPRLEYYIRKSILEDGNLTSVIAVHENGTSIVKFPVKPIVAPLSAQALAWFKVDPMADSIPGFALVVWEEMVEASARRLVKLADEHNWQRVAVPRMKGVSKILDDRFIMMKEGVE